MTFNWRRISLIVFLLILISIIFILLTLGYVCASIDLEEGYIAQATALNQALQENPGAEFTRVTGLAWTESANVIFVEDSHGGFLSEGDLEIVFDVEPEILEEWLSNPPPWEVDGWKSGPIPSEIASVAPDFGDLDMADSKIWYAAKERCCSDRNNLLYHNGNLIVISLDRGRVWLAVWDY